MKPAKSPVAAASTPALKVSQTGDAAIPARAEANTQTTSLPLPAGTEVTVSPATGAVTYRLQADSLARVEFHAERVDAPQAFTPPAPPLPPTPAEVAQGFGVRAFWIASLVCVAGAVFLAWQAHFLAAGLVGLAAVCLPVLARFFSSGVAVAVGGALVAGGICFFAAWHILAKRA